MSDVNISIAGAGLVGSLMSIYLARKGYNVQVIEKRADPRTALKQEGRSINLALSHRGIRALREASEALCNAVLEQAIPMYGRQMHDEQGKLSFQAYGANGECIYAVSRARLNQTLINEAERLGVVFLFEHSITHADVKKKHVHVQHAGKTDLLDIPVLLAADGAFSAVRKAIEAQGLCTTHIERIDHGYKELDIYPEQGLLLDNKNALHIWPRGQYMFIALPNFDNSYTGTLFLPFSETKSSFDVLKKEKEVRAFFAQHFPDTLQLLPDLTKQFTKNPTSFLANIYTDQWAFDTWLLIGDAAHGIVPFYGQGMNAGFEDCRILNNLLSSNPLEWASVFESFQTQRKIDTDAIARLAMDNFIEMRDLVADEKFLLRSNIEKALAKALPDQWKYLYGEVSFSDTPYHKALQIGQRNASIMDSIMNNATIDFKRWEEKEEWEKIVEIVSSQ